MSSFLLCQILHAKLALEFDAQKSALQQRELQAQQRMQAERDAERLKADAELEAERRRLEAQVAERMRQLDRERLEQQKRHEAMEEQARKEREQAMKESARQVQLALEQEKERLAATLREQTRSAERAMEERFHERELQMEDEKRKAEEAQRRERAEIQAAFDQRRLAMESAERERIAALAKDDKDRRDAWERERAARQAQEEATRLEQAKATQLDRAAALAADTARREAFAQQERERAARWEQEETQRQTARLTERAKFEEERAALMAQIEATKQRLEFDAAQRAASDAATRETARVQIETEKAEYRRRMEMAFETEKKRLQQLAAEDARELMRKLEAEKASSDAARESERAASIAALDRERTRLREEAEAKRAAEEARLAQERARMEAERTRELERLENDRRRLEDEREELARTTAAGIEARQTEAALKAAEEELASKQRRAREAQELAAREERHAREIAARDASHQRRLAERESALREAEQRRLSEKALRIQALEEDVERTRRELELQIAEKHATRRGLQEKVLKLTEVEDQLEKLAQMKVPPPPIRYTSNPLDVDPKDVPESDLPSVAHSIASFAKDFSTMSFRSLLALLLSIPHSQLAKAQVLLRLYLTTHPGCAKKVDEPSGLLPLHLSAQAGLYRELIDIILREHPQALKTECRAGVYPIFYACAFRRQREERAAALSSGADGTPNANIGSLLHADFSLDQVKTYNLELMKYFMAKFPDSIYLPNRLGGGEKDDAQNQMIVDPKHHGFALKSGLPLNSNGLSQLALKSGQQVDEFSPAASLSIVEYAFAEEDLELLTLLFELTSGDFLHAVDSCGRSYLHRAAMQGRLPTAQWLVEIGGVSPWQLCNADRTALEYVDPHKYEALALYLTRAMTAVSPEQRVKGRRGGRRMLIREWATEDGYGGTNGRPLGSRFIGGHDASLLSSPVRASTGAFLENWDGEWNGERMSSPKAITPGWHGTSLTTPRGSTLRPVLRSKQKLPNGHMREEYEVLEGAGNTTHIHVYPNQNGGLTNSRSLPSLLRSPHASPSSAKKTPKSRQAEAEAEYAAFEAAQAAAALAHQIRTSPTKSPHGKGYHWQFLPPPKSNGQYSHGPARAFNFVGSPVGSPTRSNGYGVHSPARSFAASKGSPAAAMRSPARVGGSASRPSSAAVERTVYSLQATTNNLQELLNEANAAAYNTPSRSSSGYRR